LFATAVGDHSADDKLPSVSVADAERREKDCAHIRRAGRAIDRTKLSDTDRINYDIFGESLHNRITDSSSRAI
jgi:uncharacterized protein (DUF885 family)